MVTDVLMSFGSLIIASPRKTGILLWKYDFFFSFYLEIHHIHHKFWLLFIEEYEGLKYDQFIINYWIDTFILKFLITTY